MHTILINSHDVPIISIIHVKIKSLKIITRGCIPWTYVYTYRKYIMKIWGVFEIQNIRENEFN